MSALARALNRPSQTPETVAPDQTAQACIREGLSQFLRAIERAQRAHPLHQSLVLRMGGGHVRLCSCGWSSVPVASYAEVELTSCRVWIAEIERQSRAVLQGRDLTDAIETLQQEAAETRRAHGG